MSNYIDDDDDFSFDDDDDFSFDDDLDDENSSVNDDLREEFLQRIIEAVGTALQDSDVGVSHRAAKVLGDLNAQTSIPALIEAFDQAVAKEERSLADAVVGALDKLRATTAIPHLIPYLEKTPASWATVRFGSTDFSSLLIRTLASLAGIKLSSGSVFGSSRFSSLPAPSSPFGSSTVPVPTPKIYPVRYPDLEAAFIRMLENTNAGSRKLAIEALGYMKIQAVVPKLLKIVESEKDAGVREAAMIALGRIGDQQAVPVLLNLLNATEFSVRKAATAALGNFGDATTTAALAKAFGANPIEVRQEIVKQLGASTDPNAVPFLMQAQTDIEPSIRDAAAEGLEAVVKRLSVADVATLLENPQEQIRLHAVNGLIEKGTAEILPVLHNCRQDESPAIRLQAIEGLGKIPQPQAVEALGDFLADSQVEVRTAVIQNVVKSLLIHPAFTPRPSSSSSVFGSSSSPRPGSSGSSPFSRPSSGATPPPAPSSTGSRFGSGTSSSSGSSGSSPFSRPSSGATPPPAPSSTGSRFGSGTSSSSGSSRFGSSSSSPFSSGGSRLPGGTSRFGQPAPPRLSAEEVDTLQNAVARVLCKALLDENGDVRWSAADGLLKVNKTVDYQSDLQLALNATGRRGEAALLLTERYNHFDLDALLDGLISGNTQLHERIMGLLTKQDAATIGPRLIPLLNSSSESLRLNAALILGKLKYEQAVPHLMNWLNGENLTLMATAAESLGELQHKAAVPRLSELIQHENEKIRMAAAGAVSNMPDASSLSALLTMLDDPENRVRLTAYAALAALPEAEDPKKIGEALLRTLAKEQDMEVRDGMADLINKATVMEDEFNSFTVLYDLVKDFSGEMLLNLADIFEMIKDGKLKPEMIAELKPDKMSEDDEEVGMVALLLGFANDPQANPWLIARLTHEDADIQRVAVWSLERIGTAEALEAVKQWRGSQKSG